MNPGQMTVDENYVLRIPDGMDMAKAAPLLCAGITTYSPLSFWGALKKGKDCAVGVAGFGGLGHMAVKIAVAAGCPVTVFSHSANKKEVVEKLGAKFVLTTDAAQMGAVAGSIDLLLNTISANHDMASLLAPLKAGPGACLVMLGVPPDNLSMHAFGIIGGRKQVAGSLIGGIKETQEMLDFCGKHNILPDINLIHPKESNHALAALHTGKMPSTAESRFVIDIKVGIPEKTFTTPSPSPLPPPSPLLHLLSLSVSLNSTHLCCFTLPIFSCPRAPTLQPCDPLLQGRLKPRAPLSLTLGPSLAGRSRRG